MDYFLSDLHLGDGSGSDDAIRYQPILIEFFRSLNDNSRVWLLGDVFEFGQLALPGDFFRILQTNERLLEVMLRHEIHMLPGNHDPQLVDLASVTWWYTHYDRTRKLGFHVIDRGHTSILLAHGHQWDWIHQTSLGSISVSLIGLIEKLGSPDIDDQLSVFYNTDLNRHAEYAAVSAKLHKCSAVIKGHTHVPCFMRSGGVDVWDTGSWIKDYKDGMPYVTVSNTGLISSERFVV